MTEPLISIIIPAYNSGKYIEKCLDSIVAQTYKTIEVVVVIAPSTDNTVTIVESYKNDFLLKTILETRKTNVAVARNVGFEKCNGQYIIFLDSDDWIEPTRLEKQVAAMTGVGYDDNWCGGYVRSVGMDGSESINTVDPSETNGSLMGILSFMFVRRCLSEEYLYYGYVFDPSLPYFDDVDLYLRVRHLPHQMVNDVVANYLLNNCGLTQTTNVISSKITMFKIILNRLEFGYLPREIKDTIATIGSKATGVDLVRWKKENFG